MGQRGFTLVELLMAAVILCLIGGMVFVIAQTGNQLWGSTDRRLASLTDAQRVLDRLTEDLRRAKRASLVAPCAAPLTFSTVADQVITYNLEGDTLVRQEQTGAQPTTSRVIGVGLSTFSVSCDPNGLVRLALTIQAQRFTDASRQTLTSQVFVQNP